MKTLFTIAILLALIFNGQAQDLKTVSVPLGARTESKKIVDGVTTHTYSTAAAIPINGDPYLKKKFTPGVIELFDGSKSNEVPMRYNIARDIFEVVQDNDTLTLNQGYKVKHIFYDDKKFIYDPEMRENSDRKYNGFFEVCEEGELTLYRKWYKDLLYDSFLTNYQGGKGTKEYYYVDKTIFVGKLQDHSAFLLNSKGKFLKHVEKEKKLVKDFIKKNKIKFRSEEDLKRLVEYYNSI